MNEHWNRALAFLGIGIAAILAIAALPLPIYATAPLILFWICWIHAAICTLSERRSLWLHTLFDPGNGGALYQTLIKHPTEWPLNWGVYDWALRLAVLYPLGFAFTAWVITGDTVTLGGAVDEGGAVVFPASQNWWDRPALICAIALLFIATHLESWASASPQGFLRKLAGWLTVIAIAVGTAIATAVAVATTVSAAFGAAIAATAAVGGVFAATVAATAAVVFASTAAVAVAIAAAVAVSITAAIFFLTDWLMARGKPSLVYTILTLSLLTALLTALMALDWTDIPADVRILLLFLGILPLLNALLDTPSYFITLSLLRIGHKHPRLAIPLAALDLVAALLLFFLTGAVLILAVALSSQLAGVELYPLAQLLSDIPQNPGTYWWLYAMVFSTVLPTMAHLAASAFSTSAWLLPRPRAWILARLTSGDVGDQLGVLFLIAALFFASLTLPFALLYGLWWGVDQWHPGYLSAYLTWLQTIACWAGPLSCPP